MKLEPRTLQILKNFASINPSLLFKPGNVISTIAPLTKAVKAEATVAETFPSEFAIYDLSKLLAVISLFDSPDIQINSNSLTVSQGSQSVDFRFADKNSIVAPPDKKLTLPNPEIAFTLPAATYHGIMKALGVLQLPEIAVQGDDSGIYIATVDSKNSSSNTYRVQVAESNGHKFDMIFRADNLKVMNIDYEVQISSRGISHFKGDGVEYWVATEANSKFQQ